MPSLADYEVLESLGSGTYGRVYKVRRRRDGVILVLKQVPMSNLTRQEQQHPRQQAMAGAAVGHAPHRRKVAVDVRGGLEALEELLARHDAGLAHGAADAVEEAFGLEERHVPARELASRTAAATEPLRRRVRE